MPETVVDRLEQVNVQKNQRPFRPRQLPIKAGTHKFGKSFRIIEMRQTVKRRTFEKVGLLLLFVVYDIDFSEHISWLFPVEYRVDCKAQPMVFPVHTGEICVSYSALLRQNNVEKGSFSERSFSFDHSFAEIKFFNFGFISDFFRRNGHDHLLRSEVIFKEIFIDERIDPEMFFQFERTPAVALRTAIQEKD